jgi:hypothetical protein
MLRRESPVVLQMTVAVMEKNAQKIHFRQKISLNFAKFIFSSLILADMTLSRVAAAG